MTNKLLIYNIDKQLIVVYFTNNGQILLEQELSQTDLHATDQVIVLTPGNATFTTMVTMPPMSSSQLQKAIPYALEDQLIADVQTLHFVVKQSSVKNNYAVAITDKNQIRQWVKQFSDLCISPDQVFPEYLALPIEMNCWQIVFTEQVVLVRTGLNTGFSIEPTLLLTTLDKLYEELGDEEKPKKIYYQNLFDQNEMKSLSNKIPPEKFVFSNEESSLTKIFIKSLTHSETKLNLLSGEFRLVRKAKKAEKLWHIALFLAVVWLLGFLMINTVSYFYLNKKNNQLQVQVNSLYYSIFPSATSVVAPEFRVQKILKQIQQQQNDQGFLYLISKAGFVIFPNKEIKLLNFSYAKQTLVITFELNHLSILSKVQQLLAAQENLQISKTTTKNIDGKAIVQLTIIQKNT